MLKHINKQLIYTFTILLLCFFGFEKIVKN